MFYPTTQREKRIRRKVLKRKRKKKKERLSVLILRFILHTTQTMHPEVASHVALDRELAPAPFFGALEWTLARMRISVDTKRARTAETLAAVLALVPAREWDCLEPCT